LITPLLGVFDQTFSQKVCVAPVDYAVTPLLSVFDQTFFEKVCEQTFF
jgi:hypothetical protein